MSANTLTKLDHTALKTNQAVIILLNMIAFILNIPWLAGIVAFTMVFGALLNSPGFKFVYRILKSTLSSYNRQNIKTKHKYLLSFRL